jgi:adenine-specific DNA-methyltransferase
MPTLNWLGKDKVVNHHADVPFCILDEKYTHGDNANENMIIKGDNLLALKALLPRYEGQVKCIYIDPPYNTGNEKWVYNDNVNDPKIKKWLGEVVGKEGEDLSRHDKWLCMMYPRLRLLQKLLADDGIIAVSIDDNEVFALGMLMNEVFGASNRLACAPWLAEPSGGREKTKIRNGHEYVLIYTNGSIESLSKDERSEGKLALKDNVGKYRKGRELRKWGGTSLRTDRPNQWFGVTAPSGEVVYPYRNDGKEGHWRWSKKNAGMIEILEDSSYAHWELCPYDEGVVVNGETERWVPFEKIREEKRTVGWSSWLDKVGYNSDGTSALKAIFGEKPFDTPKPVSLVEWIISLYDSNDSDVVVIDSFAGSGTTAHAVLKLNKQDDGNRRFIAVEMEDYAETITAERVRRVIDGYGDVEGTSGGFSFCELGEPLMFADGNLNEAIGTERIREYVWYTETRSAYTANDTEPHLLGVDNDTAYYFHYDKDKPTALDLEFLKTIKTKAERYVIYADICALSPRDLKRYNIVYKKIPRDIERF